MSSTMILTNPQEKLITPTTSVTNSSPLTESEIYDRKTGQYLFLQTHNSSLQADDEEDLKPSSSIIAFDDNYQVLQKKRKQMAIVAQIPTIYNMFK